jgi:glycosyltransferase involved in cell wall biosynthesis
MQKISAFIITKNEADRVGRCITSLQDVVDEIIVVDSGSTDDTVKLCEQMGATVMFRPWSGFGPQKVFAESQCTHNWILNLDADEELTENLKQEILELKTAHHERLQAITAFFIKRKTVFWYDKKPRKFAITDKMIRLYNKTKSGFNDSPVHDSVIIREGGVATLKSPMLHYCFRSHTHALDKINHYSTLQAEDMLKKNRRPSTLRILTEPFTAFIKSYFLRKYIVYGLDGLIQTYIYVFARILRLAKAREMFQIKKS